MSPGRELHGQQQPRPDRIKELFPRPTLVPLNCYPRKESRRPGAKYDDWRRKRKGQETFWDEEFESERNIEGRSYSVTAEE